MTNYVAESGQALTGLAGASRANPPTADGGWESCLRAIEPLFLWREVVPGPDGGAPARRLPPEHMAVGAQDRAGRVAVQSCDVAGVERTLFRRRVLIALGLNEELPGTDGAFVDRALHRGCGGSAILCHDPGRCCGSAPSASPRSPWRWMWPSRPSPPARPRMRPSSRRACVTRLSELRRLMQQLRAGEQRAAPPSRSGAAGRFLAERAQTNTGQARIPDESGLSRLRTCHRWRPASHWSNDPSYGSRR